MSPIRRVIFSHIILNRPFHDENQIADVLSGSHLVEHYHLNKWTVVD